MIPDPAYDMSLLSPLWSDLLNSDEADDLEAEIKRDVPAGHRLHDVSFRVVAARKLRKEVIVWLPDALSWGWVHLTWTAESDPRWPTTQVFTEWASVVVELQDAGRA